MKTLGDRIKTERENLGLTQLELAACVKRITGKYSRGALALIEAGQTKTLKHDNAMAMASCLDVDVDWLVSGKGDKKNEKINTFVDMRDFEPDKPDKEYPVLYDTDINDIAKYLQANKNTKPELISAIHHIINAVSKDDVLDVLINEDSEKHNRK